MLRGNKSPGFTLIEFLLITALVGLMLWFSIPDFLEFNRREVLKRVVTDITDTIKETQGFALSGVQGESSFITYYRFVFDLESDPNYYYRYRIERVNEDGDLLSPSLEVTDVIAPVCVNSSEENFNYMVPTGQLVGLSVSPAVFDVCYPDVGKYQVTVDNGGRVYRSDFQDVSCVCL